MPSSIAFRVDASTAIGTGHVMRCLTLAEALRDHDAQSYFICRDHEGSLSDLIEQRGFEAVRLPRVAPPSIGSDGSSYAHWLAADWRADALQTREVIARQAHTPLWLIVDHYGIDEQWERELRTAATHLMVVDDLANRRHDCDLLLDQNLVDDQDSRYAGKLPGEAIALVGPAFALLQPVYRELRGHVRPRSGALRRLLISFGGVDQDNLTSRSLAAFLQLQRSDIAVDVVIGKAMRHAMQVRQLAAGHDNLTLHESLPTLAHLIARADLAIGAAGVTSWERLCLGLPALVVTLADNQRAPASRLHDAGLIRWLGDSNTVDQSALFAALKQLAGEDLPESWSLRCAEAVDGLGARRVCAALLVTADTPLRIRLADASDEALLLVWANDPATRRNAFCSDPISADTHHHWLQRRLAAPQSTRIYIAETEFGVPVGQVRFEKSAVTWVISYSLDAMFRGRGCGRSLLQAALRSFAADRPGAAVSGQVKATNQPSCRIFETLGFSVVANDGAVVEYRRAV